MAITTEMFDREHKHFGGIIYQSDFYTNFNYNSHVKKVCNGSPIARRIAYDFKWEDKILSDSFKNSYNRNK